jgi:hypothetical protein
MGNLLAEIATTGRKQWSWWDLRSKKATLTRHSAQNQTCRTIRNIMTAHIGKLNNIPYVTPRWVLENSAYLSIFLRK